MYPLDSPTREAPWELEKTCTTSYSCNLFKFLSARRGTRPSRKPDTEEKKEAVYYDTFKPSLQSWGLLDQRPVKQKQGTLFTLERSKDAATPSNLRKGFTKSSIFTNIHWRLRWKSTKTTKHVGMLNGSKNLGNLNSFLESKTETMYGPVTRAPDIRSQFSDDSSIVSRGGKLKSLTSFLYMRKI